MWVVTGKIPSVDTDAVFGRVVLVIGRDDYLVEREVDDRVARARRERPAAVVTRAQAADLSAGSLTEMTGGSLFDAASIVVIRDIADAAADLAPAIVDLARHPQPDLALILIHPGGVKGKALLDALKKAHVDTVDCPDIKPWELPQFVQAEARRAGARLAPDAAKALVDAVGTDPRSLAAALRQLLLDATDGITRAVIQQYFGGKSDVTSFAVADEALAGRTAGALERLRWALATGVAPVLVTSALAGKLRTLATYLDATSTGHRDPDLAAKVGVPPWRLKELSETARHWSPTGVAHAIRATATADAEVKGAATDPGYALERLVLAVIASRGRQ